MNTVVISGVKKSELPADWAKKVQAQDVSGTFRIIIEAERQGEPEEDAFSLAQAMRGMEDEEGPSYDLADCKERWK